MDIGYCIVHSRVNCTAGQWIFHFTFNYQLYRWAFDVSLYIQVAIRQMNIGCFIVNSVVNFTDWHGFFTVHSVVTCTEGHWIFHCTCTLSYQLYIWTFDISLCIQFSNVQTDIGHFIVHSVFECTNRHRHSIINSVFNYTARHWTFDCTFSFELYRETLDISL